MTSLRQPLEIGKLLVDLVAMVVPVLERLLALLQQVEPRLGRLRLDRDVVIEVVMTNVFVDSGLDLYSGVIPRLEAQYRASIPARDHRQSLSCFVRTNVSTSSTQHTSDAC